ncbi:hypothetical protein Bca52824_034713 [Brassica carinata]|uniref:Uncharacterized protein n=1 Tax=Brassica carinata TaxID=52824 RepID=A0A8X7S2B9_BRACI|nr:hypothetical protein Bca52824_034713 [Brassica carinata]
MPPGIGQPAWQCCPAPGQCRPVPGGQRGSAGRFVRGFWITPVKRKQTKAGGSSKAEPPIKKQKKVSSIVEDEAAVEGKGASEKEGTEDIENKKRFDIADLVRISVEEYLSKVRTTIFIAAITNPPPPPQQSVTSPPAKASISSSPAKAITIVAQASDVDFVTVSPSKDPARTPDEVKV